MAKNNRIIIPCRTAYMHVLHPVSQWGGPEKYSLCAIVSKDDRQAIELIQTAVEETKERYAARWGNTGGHIRTPIHDGDTEKNDPIFKNAIYFTARSTERPQVVDRNVELIKDDTQIYSGMYVLLSVTFYGYSLGQHVHGVGINLCNIQKVRDAPALGGRVAAKDEFQPLPHDDFLQ